MMSKERFWQLIRCKFGIHDWDQLTTREIGWIGDRGTVDYTTKKVGRYCKVCPKFKKT